MITWMETLRGEADFEDIWGNWGEAKIKQKDGLQQPLNFAWNALNYW